MDFYFVGIDLGTTSVKVDILNSSGSVLDSCWVDTAAYETRLPSENQGHEHQSDATLSGDSRQRNQTANKKQQNVCKIVSSLQSCIGKLDQELLRKVQAVALCGQMHGVLLWSSEDISNKSSLITWEDGRCSQEFLASLPQPSSGRAVSSGFGCATLFWLSRNEPNVLEGKDCAGTIMDYIVAQMCGLSAPVMSDQNAYSWGYYNTSSVIDDQSAWDSDMLTNHGFPTSLLPSVVKSGSVIGRIESSEWGFPVGCPVLVAMGDMQCSVRAVNLQNDSIVVNMGTSAQISAVVTKPLPPPSGPVDYVPYFKDAYLAVGASLNGGNVLEAFVTMMHGWVLRLGKEEVSKDTIWNQLIRDTTTSQLSSSDSLHAISTLYGERHDPSSTAAWMNMTPATLFPEAMFGSLCDGLVSNLLSMLPPYLLEPPSANPAHWYIRIVGVGNALLRNKFLEKSLRKRLEGWPVTLELEASASTGAALIALDSRQSSSLY